MERTMNRYGPEQAPDVRTILVSLNGVKKQIWSTDAIFANIAPFTVFREHRGGCTTQRYRRYH
jgi:hypothetical protein